VPIAVAMRNRRKVHWTGTCERDNVQFGFTPTKGRKVPVKYHASVNAAASVLQVGQMPAALESDGDHADDD
jgi:hypothetical protein